MTGEIGQIYNAIAERICTDKGIDPDVAKIENRVGHVRVYVERPATPKWPVAMTPGPEDLAKDVHVNLETIEQTLETLIDAHLALKGAHDEFAGEPPLWATGVHPLVKAILSTSTYSAEELLRSSRSTTWKPEEREELTVGGKGGLYLEVKLLRLRTGRIMRNRGTYATIDLPKLPSTVVNGMIGRSFADYIEGPEGLEHITIDGAIDLVDQNGTRLQSWADLVPIENNTAENPWWISKWSAFQDLRMDRHK